MTPSREQKYVKSFLSALGETKNARWEKRGSIQMVPRMRYSSTLKA
jgi:hypothetical protein